MTDSRAGVNPWMQLSLLPPGPSNIVVKLLIDPEADFANYSIEVRDAATGTLTGMHVMPCRRPGQWHLDLPRLWNEVEGAVANLVHPF